MASIAVAAPWLLIIALLMGRVRFAAAYPAPISSLPCPRAASVVRARSVWLVVELRAAHMRARTAVTV